MRLNLLQLLLLGHWLAGSIILERLAVINLVRVVVLLLNVRLQMLLLIVLMILLLL